MNTVRLSRTAAIVCIAITACAVLYAAAVALTGWEPSLGYLAQAVIHLGELAAVIALALSSAAGNGWLARIGLGAAMLGQVLLVAAELIHPSSPDIGDQMFNVGPPLSAIGLLLAGVAVIRSRRWTSWHRFTPLVAGAYVFVVLIPVLIVSGAPPAPSAVWAIAGWEVCWMLIGISVLAVGPITAGAPSRAAVTSG